jgi:hypothetical protein
LAANGVTASSPAAEKQIPGSRLAGSNGVFCVFYDLDQHGIVYHNQEFVFRPPEKKP